MVNKEILSNAKEEIIKRMNENKEYCGCQDFDAVKLDKAEEIINNVFEELEVRF